MPLPAVVAGAFWTLRAAALAAMFTALMRLMSYGVLAALGISIVSVVGFESLEGLILDDFMDRIGPLPTTIIQIIALTRIDQAMAIILGAWTFSATLGVVGAVTRWRRGLPGTLTA